MTVLIRKLSPKDAGAAELIDRLDRYLQALYPAESNHLDSVEELSKPHVHFLGAFDEQQPLGCGAVKLMEQGGYGEVKRIYVDVEARGRGVGRRLLDSLEAIALQAGYTVLKLETGIHQTEALKLFERQGFVPTGRFGAYPEDPLSVFLEKRIGVQNP